MWTTFRMQSLPQVSSSILITIKNVSRSPKVIPNHHKFKVRSLWNKLQGNWKVIVHQLILCLGGKKVIHKSLDPLAMCQQWGCPLEDKQTPFITCTYIYSVSGESQQISTNKSRIITCCAANVYIFVYIVNEGSLELLNRIESLISYLSHKVWVQNGAIMNAINVK